jgi:catechol 2,3-dioxygenase-like lactoylglutathione lyase family enzyme
MQIGIIPHDLDRSLAFYRDVLGFTYVGGRPVIEGRTLHMFEVDGGVLKLLEQPAGAAVPTPHTAGPFQGTTGLRWMTFDVEGIDDIVARCAGRIFQMPLTELRPGLKVCIVEDDDGNAVELVERRG